MAGNGIRDQNVNRAANLQKQILVVPLSDLATGQTNAFAYKFTPGYKFKVVKVTSYARTKAGTVTARVRIDSNNVVSSVSFTAGSEVNQTLTTTLANRVGKTVTSSVPSSQLTVDYTTDGSGALVDGFVTIVIQPWPLNGELNPVG